MLDLAVARGRVLGIDSDNKRFGSFESISVRARGVGREGGRVSVIKTDEGEDSPEFLCRC
jgi:hypothetical protein